MKLRLNSGWTGLGAAVLWLLVTPACGGDDEGRGPRPLPSTCAPGLAAEGVTLPSCTQGSLTLLPRVMLDGAWHGGGDDGGCQLDAGVLRCPAGAAGSVSVALADGNLTLEFTATAAASVNGFALAGSARIPGARAWLSNGFQSWSQSGALALGAPASDAALAAALALRGDTEVLRSGKELSNTYSVVGGDKSHLLAGAISASMFKPWVRAWDLGSDQVGIEVACGASGETVGVAPGDTVTSEAFELELGSDVAALLHDYAAKIPSRRTQLPRATESGWNSWYEFWDGVSEQNVRDNAPLAKQSLASWLGADATLRIVVDDGWESAWGEWQPNTKFPSGLDGLAKDLRAAGYEMGVWLAPLLVSESSALVTDHPDWFVKDAVYKHLKNGNMRVLDVTNPGAAQHLESVITSIVGWGYDLLKIDFLFAGTYEGQRYENVTGMQAYARALSLIRKAAGENVVLVAVGAPDVATFPYVDAWRVGGDIALEATGPSWVFIPSQARSVAARVPFCMTTLCDADPLIQRTLEREEVESGGWVVAFAGGALFLSDDQTTLPAERRSYGLDAERVALARGGVPAIPRDFLPENAPTELVSAILDQFVAKKSSRHVVPRIWRLPDGHRVGMNCTDDAVSIDGKSVPGRSVRPLD